jgi:hypothetical protein
VLGSRHKAASDQSPHVGPMSCADILSAAASPRAFHTGTVLRWPIAKALMRQRVYLRTNSEDDAADQEHLSQIAQGQAVAQPPQHHEGDDVARILDPVQQPGAALVVLLAAIPGSGTGGSLGRCAPAARSQRPVDKMPPVYGWHKHGSRLCQRAVSAPRFGCAR